MCYCIRLFQDFRRCEVRQCAVLTGAMFGVRGEYFVRRGGIRYYIVQCDRERDNNLKRHERQAEPYGGYEPQRADFSPADFPLEDGAKEKNREDCQGRDDDVHFLSPFSASSIIFRSLFDFVLTEFLFADEGGDEHG